MIPFLDLKKIKTQYQTELKEDCSRVIDSGWCVLGIERVYTQDTLTVSLQETGLHFVENGRAFFKPLSDKKIQDLWAEKMIQGFCELGNNFPENAAEPYAVCSSS